MKSTLKLFSVLFAAAFAMVLTGCSGNSPADVAKKWNEAVFKGDKAKAMEYVYSNDEEMEKDTANLIKEIRLGDGVAFGEAKIDGDTAEVRMRVKQNADGDKKTYIVKLEKEDGKWLISDIVDEEEEKKAKEKKEKKEENK